MYGFNCTVYDHTYFLQNKKLSIKGETTQLTIDNMAQAVIDVDPNKKPEYMHTFIDWSHGSCISLKGQF